MDYQGPKNSAVFHLQRLIVEAIYICLQRLIFTLTDVHEIRHGLCEFFALKEPTVKLLS